MTKAIEIIQKPRISLVKLIKELSPEQLNLVPPGFNNNIIWNAGHLIAAQQGVCYRRAGLEMRIDESFFLLYKPGSKPESFIDTREVEKLCELLLSTLDQFETDYQHSLFSNYIPWTTRYGVELNTIDEAVNFLPFHEGLHIGHIMALKRLIVK